MKNTPIDVVIPVYNGAKYINDCIKSVLAQTYPINKIIVVNDGSTDDTEDIVLDLSRKFSQIEYIKIPKTGVSAARNLGIQKSQSDFLLLC